MSHLDFIALKQWFQREARSLPWRDSPSPYAVWISEIMLQQTRVAVVIPYFERWMQKFPTLQSLAAAPLDSVIKAWEGLGYYSRARNIHHAAQQIVHSFDGQLPASTEGLKSLKGLGPYTIGAIQAFAFRQKAAALDGNVMRVLARHELIKEDISKPKTQSRMRKRTLELLPENEPWIASEALIELGATICGRDPQCPRCPLQRSCKAHAEGVAHLLPIKGKKATSQALYRALALVVVDDHVLVRRCPSGEIMSDLHEFPAFDLNSPGLQTRPFYARLRKHWPMKLTPVRQLEEIKHTYTRYRVTLFPVLFATAARIEIAGYFWHPVTALPQLAFSAGHRKLVPQLQAST